jgi:cell division protein FtsX
MKAAQVARGGPSLLPGAASPSPWLALAIFVLSVVAGLELVAATAAIRAAIAWSPRLAGSATVAVSGGGLESAEAAAARATEILARSPEVARISVLDPDPADAIAGRIMGLAGATPGGEPPRLLATTFVGGDSASAAALAQDLRRENVAAAVDDHGVWTGPIERTAVLVSAAAGGLLLVMIALVWGLAAASAGAAVGRRADRVRLLLHLGATDGMILGPFRARAVGAAALGALIGTGAAAALAAVAIWWPAVADRISAQTAALIRMGPGLDAWDLAATAIWLPVAVVTAAWAAGGAATARLRALA